MQDEMDRACSMHEGMRNAYKILNGNLKGRGHLGDLDEDGK
jgi:hypothetical protein